ncbi:DUF1592 domain-containing protein [Paraliomyxa miuraensis]|uniref:DUF1592 domain-containing protein n=1 Tax=Paraliomyxa miuraensis TaxID=376150 RepID=UPI00225A6E77|nr:DUF1592 domain-containing protein [Paraliomyxa miuraensis]MCX4239575.1 DUF1592 domain-containing protein [Paraliomyxa miuraensis]
MSISRIASLTLAVLPVLACKSTPGAEDTNDTDGTDGIDDMGECDVGDGDCEAAPRPGPTPIRRLTRVEYDNTIYQLFGDNSHPADAFPPDEEAGGFDNQADVLVVSPLLAESYLSAAEQLAATHTPTLMQQLPHCQGDSVDEASCEGDADAFVRSFGKLVFRRPLTDEEVGTYVELFARGTTLAQVPYSPDMGVQLVVQALLQSPHFIYRVELGMADPRAGDVVALTHYEIASRLSYLLWNSMPDALLFEAADAERLHDPAELEAQARRMLDTPRAHEAVGNFHRQWLHLDEIEPVILANGKDPEIYPEFYDGLPSLWRSETEAFIDHVVFEEDANLESLLTAPYTMMNEELAGFYGVDGPTGIGFTRVDLDPGKYAGFMTQPGLMALFAKPDRSSPIHRGMFVRETILCQTPPPPPDNVPEPPSVDESQTTREQFAQHAEDPVCAGCHALMDPIGFGFEHFDGIGRYRATEWGLEVDAAGELKGTDVDGTFDGAVELAHRLASSDQVKACVVSQWFRFGYGRYETEEDEDSIAELHAAFAASDYDIKELIVALTQTDAFRYRHAIQED